MKSLYPIIEAGPIAFIPDTECPDYLHMIPNPTSCFTPPIVTFKEMHEAEYKDEYKYFIYGLLQNKTLPLGKLSRYDYEDICIQDIEFKTIRLNRVGKTTFRYSSVVQAIFSVATARGCITISEWYMIPGQYDTRDGIWLFQNIHVYDSSSAPVSDMTDYLVPKITDYEYEAKRMLSFFQSEALKKPCRINAESMAKKMKFSVRYVRLSPDNSVQGKIVFSKATLTLYNKDGIPYTEDIYENTMPSVKRPEITLLDESEQAKLQEYIAQNQNKATLGVALSMTTGIRVGELTALQWKDIDLEKRILTVSKTLQRVQSPDDGVKTKLIITEPKSDKSRRKIPIPQGMVAFLQKFKGKDNEYILSGKEKPIEPRAMQYRFSKILKNAKLPSVHFHALRHIFASTCIKLGFDVKALSELLGHSSIELTLNRYVHSSFEQKIAYMDRLKVNF